MTKIKGKNVLITGGASGIGKIMGRMALEKWAPDSDFFADMCEIIKARMLAADITKAVFTTVQNDAAKPFFVEMGASFIFCELEVWSVFYFDAISYIFAIFTLK